MAPELVEKKGYDGVATDCWALGVLLYKILINRTPFGDWNEANLEANIVKGNWAIPREAGLPESVEDLIRNLLVKKPNRR